MGELEETEIAGFRIKSLLGEGAMARVYLAHDLVLGRRVALKLFKPGAVDDSAEAFLREARATAAIDHPNIVHIYQTGMHGGLPFLALEFIEGESLRTRLRAGPLQAVEALRIALAIADGLAAAHERGVIHGDLKPENVLISPSGRVRLVDFGLARAVGGEAHGDGTEDYMAPERWLRTTLSPSIDVWALGMMLQEMTAGRKPFVAREIVAAVYARSRLSVEDAPDRVHELAARCLAWEPATRPQARALAESLHRQLRGDVPTAQAPFRGLVAFSEAEAGDFWGREDETNAALERLRRATLLAIVGPSGVGKSSFVRASVAPRLRAHGDTAIVYLRPGEHPLASLTQALGATLDASDREEQTRALEQSPERLRLILADTVRAHVATKVVLVVDQLEEAFTLARAEEATAFFAALVSAAQEQAAPWRVIVLVRDDFLGRLYQSALGGVLDAVMPLKPLSVAELEAAIRGPVSRCGHGFEPAELPARIALDVASQPAPLPLLQFACQAVWERRDRARALVLGSVYDEIGGAAGALAREAEQLVATLTPAERTMTRALFLSLLAPDGTRVPQPLTELTTRLGADVSRLTERFVSRRLLSIRRDGEQAMVEIAHESLASLWPELRRWLDESSDVRRVLRDAEEAAELWRRRGRPRSETWRGDALRGALAKLESAGVAPAAVVDEFLAASREEDRRAGRWRRFVAIVFVLMLSSFAATASVFAIRFRENEKRALAQKEQLRMAAENMGPVELTLAPFEWGPADHRRVPVDAAALAGLGWRLWRASAADPEQPVLDSPLPIRPIGDVKREHELRQSFEAPGGAAFLEIFGRGAAQEQCASSWVRLRALPGYAEHERGQVLRVRVPVPTCRASRAGQIEIGAGPFLMPEHGQDRVRVLPAFWIDETELTNAAFAPFAELLAVSGYERVWPPDDGPLRGAAQPEAPVTGVDAAAAQAVCRFYGKRLPTRAEWIKAWRGPSRAEPSGDDSAALVRDVRARARAANLGGAEDGAMGPVPPRQLTADRSPYGVLAMTGNVREWTATGDESDARQILRHVLGGDWGMPRDQLERYLFTNANHPRAVDFDLGARCVADRR
jgi:eukaryotic-like serine/threonine-protein kinase